MKAVSTRDMSTEMLIEKYIEIGIAQGEAIENFETAKFNRLFDQKAKLVRELRSRPGDERHRLLKLYDHPNLQVRLNAVNSTYALNPDAARRVFEEVQASKRFPWAGDAGMSLSMLEIGLSKLPEDPWI